MKLFEAVKSFIKTFIHIFTFGLYDVKEKQVDKGINSFEKYQTPVESTEWTVEEISKFEKRWDGIVKINRIPPGKRFIV